MYNLLYFNKAVKYKIKSTLPQQHSEYTCEIETDFSNKNQYPCFVVKLYTVCTVHSGKRD